MDPCSIPRRTWTIPPAPRAHTPRISATPGTLPPGQLARPITIPGLHGPDRDHYLMVLDLDQITDDVERLEATYRALRGPIRPQVWHMLGTPDPDHDLVGYLNTRWWTPGMRATIDMILETEARGRAYPWPHGHTAGPILTPTR